MIGSVGLSSHMRPAGRQPQSQACDTVGRLYAQRYKQSTNVSLCVVSLSKGLINGDASAFTVAAAITPTAATT